MYRVLEPVLEPTGEVSHTADGEIRWNRVKEWRELGIAQDLADSYRKFPRGRRYGYAHVLEEIKVH